MFVIMYSDTNRHQNASTFIEINRSCVKRVDKPWDRSEWLAPARNDVTDWILTRSEVKVSAEFLLKAPQSPWVRESDVSLQHKRLHRLSTSAARDSRRRRAHDTTDWLTRTRVDRQTLLLQVILEEQKKEKN